jgi:hypothetical protein
LTQRRVRLLYARYGRLLRGLIGFLWLFRAVKLMTASPP